MKVDSGWLTKTIEEAEEGMASYRKELATQIRNIYGTKSAKTFPWTGCSNVRSKVYTSLVETIVPRIIKSIHEIKPCARIIPRRGDTTAESEVWESFLDWSLETEFRRTGRSYLNVKEDVYRTAVMHGTAIEKVHWKTITNTYRDIETRQQMILDANGQPTLDANGQPVVENVDEEVVKEGTIYDAPIVEMVDLKDFIIPINSASIADAPFVVHKFKIKKAHLKRLLKEKKYENGKKVMAYKEDDINEIDEERESLQGLKPISGREEVVLHEYWGLYDIDGDGLEEECQIVFHKPTSSVLFADYNPFKHGMRPFVEYRLIPRPNFFFGWGIYDVVHEHSDLIDTLFNQMIDNNTLTNMPVFTYVKRAGMSQSYEITPGTFLPVWNQNDIQQLMTVGKANIENELINIVFGLIQKVTGATDYSMGMTSSISENRTKGGIMSIISEGNIRFDLTIKRFQDSNALEWLQILQLNAQYREPLMFSKISGKTGKMEMVPFTREQIQDWPDIYPQGNLISSNKFIEADTWREIIRLLGQDQSGDINTRNLKQKFIQAQGIKDYNAIVRSPEETDQIKNLQTRLQQMSRQMQEMGQQYKSMQNQLAENQMKMKVEAAAHEGEKRMDEYFNTVIPREAAREAG